MRHHSLVLLGALTLGCNDGAKEPRVEPEAGVEPETGTDAAAVPSSLPRPSLPRPPLQGLPAELRPPAR